MAGLAALGCAARLSAKPAVGITDSHVHVFRLGLPLAKSRRYTPTTSAPTSDLLAIMARYGVTRAVLVQPSFLGTDNRYLLAALSAQPNRFRGVVALPPHVPDDDVSAMHALGVRGVRLNLIEAPDPDLGSAAWRNHFAALRKHGWCVELQAQSRRLPRLIEHVRTAGLVAVVDHFGRPDPHEGIHDRALGAIVQMAKGGGVFIKLSGAYRLASGTAGAQLARSLSAMLVDSVGPDALMWGSDWPHTQHSAIDYGDTVEAANAWLPRLADRAQAMAGTADRLFSFGNQRTSIS